MHAVVELSWEVRLQTFLRTKPYGYSMHNEVGTCEEILPNYSTTLFNHGVKNQKPIEEDEIIQTLPAVVPPAKQGCLPSNRPSATVRGCTL